MTSDEKAMYTGMAMSRNTEVTLRWSRSQMFMIINSAMLSLVFSRDVGFGLLLTLGIFGLIMSSVWFVINEKSQQWVEYWQTRLSQIRHEEEPTTVNVFIGQNGMPSTKVSHSTRYSELCQAHSCWGGSS